MSFNSAAWAANVTRISERENLDSLAVDNVFKVVKELKRLVEPWGVYEVVQVKIARAIVERTISPTRVGEIIEATIVRLRNQRQRKLPKDHEQYIRSPGGYFMSSIKSEFAKAGVPWNRLAND